LLVHALIQAILHWYFGMLHGAGLLGVVVLMAMESTIFPVPSELVVPPAAYILAYNPQDGSVSIPMAILVVVAGTVGSYLGSAITYWVSRIIGRPVIVRYGKYVLIPEKKLRMAEQWVDQYGAGGIFFARLLPVVRHLISIPAGIIGMRFRSFSLMTSTGSCLWCAVLTVFGLLMAKDMRTVVETMADSEPYKIAFRNLTIAVVLLVGAMIVLYIAVVKRKSRALAKAAPAAEPAEPGAPAA
jgi:membrane protein DedA with SNARE-associated domain